MNNSSIVFHASQYEICKHAILNSNTLDEAFQKTKGLFPKLALAHFMDIDRQKTMKLLNDAWSNKHQNNEHDYYHECESFVFSTWKFSVESAQLIADIAWKSDSRVCLIGTPTLIKKLPPRNNKSPHLFIDIQEQKNYRDDVEYIVKDINLLDGSEYYELFDVCVFDPPWYLDTYRKWGCVARSYCRIGGKIVFSLMGCLTKPTAADDRKIILSEYNNGGANVVVKEDAILYDVPTFESSMLKRADIPCVKWKRSDLVLADKTASSQSTLSCKAQDLSPNVKSISIMGIVFEIILGQTSSPALSPPMIEVPNTGFWMETPSKRSADVRSCNIFTSNGAMFITNEPKSTFESLSLLINKPKNEQILGLLKIGFPEDYINTSYFLKRHPKPDL